MSVRFVRRTSKKGGIEISHLSFSSQYVITPTSGLNNALKSGMLKFAVVLGLFMLRVVIVLDCLHPYLPQWGRTPCPGERGSKLSKTIVSNGFAQVSKNRGSRQNDRLEMVSEGLREGLQPSVSNFRAFSVFRGFRLFQRALKTMVNFREVSSRVSKESEPLVVSEGFQRDPIFDEGFSKSIGTSLQ